MKKQQVKYLATGLWNGEKLEGKINEELEALNGNGYRVLSVSISPDNGTTIILYEKTGD